MAVNVEVDVEILKSEIEKKYASVSQEPENDRKAARFGARGTTGEGEQARARLTNGRRVDGERRQGGREPGDGARGR